MVENSSITSLKGKGFRSLKLVNSFSRSFQESSTSTGSAFVTETSNQKTCCLMTRTTSRSLTLASPTPIKREKRLRPPAEVHAMRPLR